LVVFDYIAIVPGVHIENSYVASSSKMQSMREGRTLELCCIFENEVSFLIYRSMRLTI